MPVAAVANAKAVRERQVTVCLRAHSLDAVKETCYRYAASHYSQLQVSDQEAQAIVTFAFPSTIGVGDEEAILASFQHDLLDQGLRERIAKQTEVVRNLIFANAFANTPLLDDD